MSTPPRHQRARAPFLALACAVALLAFASPAMAGTATFDTFTGVVTFDAAAAETNAVTFSDGGGGGLVRVSDANQAVTPADASCTQDVDGSALCGDGVLAASRLVATLADGDDSASTSLTGVPVSFDGGTDADTLTGGDQADILTGGTGTDTLNGGGGDDTLNGGDDGDTLNGGTGADTLNGDAGADVLSGDDDADTLNGGSDDDSLDGGAGPDVINGGFSAGDAVTYAARTESVSVSLNGTADDGAAGEGDNVSGVGVILGGSGDDALTGDGGSNTLVGNGGNDTLSGEGGNDSLSGGSGADSLDGGSGADTMDGGADEDELSYASHSSPVTASLSSVAGNGSLGENDTATNFEDLTGGSGDDILSGDDANNVIRGNGGSDRLNGNGGNDVLQGGDGDDQLKGNGGDDSLDGGANDDALTGGAGADDLWGGDGEDVVSYSDHADAVAADLDGAAGDDGNADDGAQGARDTIRPDVEDLTGTGADDLLGGSSGPNVITGGSGRDYIAGNDGADTLLGGGDNDTLAGGAQNDSVQGGDGDDLLDGGDGTDQLSGGSGTDYVTYASRTAPVNASLDGLADDGALGENDAIASDVEGLVGGKGDDTLDGNSSPNYLDGQDGNDTITGGPGVDTMLGRDQNDTINARDGTADNIDCGDGTDSVVADATENYGSGCEAIDSGASGGSTPGGGIVIPGGPGAGGGDAGNGSDWNSFIANILNGSQLPQDPRGSFQGILGSLSAQGAVPSAIAAAGAGSASGANTVRTGLGIPRSHPRSVSAKLLTVRVRTLPATVVVKGTMSPATKVGKAACGVGFVQATVSMKKGSPLVAKTSLTESCGYRLVLRLTKRMKLRAATRVKVRFLGNPLQLPFTVKPALSLRVG